MKLKFCILTFLLLFSRGCDFYSTSLWFFQPGGMEGETNPLTRFFGVGWTGLIISNAIIIGLIIYAFYYFSFRYTARKINEQPATLREYASLIYFEQKGQFHRLFYSMPKNKKLLLAHLGYVLVRVVIIASFLATFHNLCQYYNVSFYNTFREIVKRPLFVIYGLILFSFVYFQFRILNREYKSSKHIA